MRSERAVAEEGDARTSPALADKAVGWIYSHLHRFIALGANQQPDNRRVQALSELALFCWLVGERNPILAGDGRVLACLSAIRETYDNPIFFERLLRGADPLVSQALIAIALHRSGFLADDELRIFQNVVNRSNVLLSERLAHRQLELRHILEAGGLVFELPSYKTLYNASVAAKVLNPIYVTDFDTYSLTHTLFYCSDFGAREVAGASRQQITRVARTTNVLLGMYTVKKDWDLVAELLLSCRCLNEKSSLVYAIAWEELRKTQWESGAVPGPTYHREKEQSLPEDEKQSYVFEQCYHTTLVAGLVGALCQPPVNDQVEVVGA